MDLTKAMIFFEDNTDNFDLFMQVLKEVFREESSYEIRITGVIGVAKQYEHMRFYISKKNGDLYIKFKEKPPLLFCKENINEFKIQATQVNELFLNNIEQYTIGNKKMMRVMNSYKD